MQIINNGHLFADNTPRFKAQIDGQTILDDGRWDEVRGIYDFEPGGSDDVFKVLSTLKSSDLTASFCVFQYHQNLVRGIDVGLYEFTLRHDEVEFAFAMQLAEFVRLNSIHYTGLLSFFESYSHPNLKIEIEYGMYSETKIDLNESYTHFRFRFPFISSVMTHFQESNQELKSVFDDFFTAFGGFPWKSEYNSNETLFCLEWLKPLFIKMGFDSVNYSHGPNEFGKDFTFNKVDEFGVQRRYGVQVKAGNLSGNANSSIGEILSQISDGFDMPYHDLNSKEKMYISQFIVIISGYFTHNAKEKIVQKISNGIKGAVYFFDRDKVESLVEKYLRN